MKFFSVETILVPSPEKGFQREERLMRMSMFVLMLIAFPNASILAANAPMKSSTTVRQMNFHKDFCPQVEKLCGPDLDDSASCLQGMLNVSGLKKVVKNRHFILITGLGGEFRERNDYFDKTTMPILKQLGVPEHQIEKWVESSLVNTEKSADNLCARLATVIADANSFDKISKSTLPTKIVLLGHSRGSRVLARMAYEKCPATMSDSRIESIIGVQSAIGASALANMEEQFDSSRWSKDSTCRKTSRFNPQILSKTGALIAPELGFDLMNIATDKFSPSNCPSCKSKFFFFTSAWHSQNCEPNRIFGHNTVCFLGVKDGLNDNRLPVSAQSNSSLGRVLGHMSCASHTDLFKQVAYPGHPGCQKAANLWMIEAALNASGAL